MHFGVSLTPNKQVAAGGTSLQPEVEVGKLPADVAGFLAPLLDAGMVSSLRTRTHSFSLALS